MAWLDRQDLRKRTFRTEEIVIRDSGESSHRVIERFFYFDRKKAKFGQFDRAQFAQEHRREATDQPPLRPSRRPMPPPHHLRGW